MIICGADVDGNLPNFKQNLRCAARWHAKMAQLYPGLARPVLFDYRYYNPVYYTHLPGRNLARQPPRPPAPGVPEPEKRRHGGVRGARWRRL